MRPLFFIFTFLALKLSINANLYFSTTDTRVHSSKDITNFLVNLKNLKDLIVNLTLQHQYVPNIFNNIETPSKQRIHFDNYLSKNNRSATVSSMIRETHALIFDCIDNLNSIHDEAAYNFDNSISPPTETPFGPHHRTTRGIPVISDILRWVADEPSPELWKAHFSMEKDLSQIIKGNIIPGMGRVEHIIKAHEDTFDHIIPIMDNLEDSEMVLEHLFDLVLDILRDDQYLLRICLRGQNFANRVLNDSLIIKNIHESALRNQPDPFLFPSHFLNEHIGSYRLDSDNEDVFSEDPHQIRSLETAITVIHTNGGTTKIHSLLLIPCINRSHKFKFLQHPILSHDDTLILKNVETHSMKPIDIFGCNSNKESILLFSSKDLSFSCKRWNLALTYICFKRQILLKVGPNPCENFSLKGSLAVELSPTLILLKSHLKHVIMDCNNFPHKIIINTTYSKIFLPIRCGLRGEDFEVSSYPSSTFLNSQDPSTISIIPLETIENLLLSNLKENISKIWTHHANMSQDISHLANDNNEAKSKILKIDEVEKTLSNFDTSPQLLFLYSAVPILIICLLAAGVCYCCRKKGSYTTSNINFTNPLKHSFFSKTAPPPPKTDPPPNQSRTPPGEHEPPRPPKFTANSARESLKSDEENIGNNWTW